MPHDPLRSSSWGPRTTPHPIVRRPARRANNRAVPPKFPTTSSPLFSSLLHPSCPLHPTCTCNHLTLPDCSPQCSWTVALSWPSPARLVPDGGADVPGSPLRCLASFLPSFSLCSTSHTISAVLTYAQLPVFHVCDCFSTSPSSFSLPQLCPSAPQPGLPTPARLPAHTLTRRTART